MKKKHLEYLREVAKRVLDKYEEVMGEEYQYDPRLARAEALHEIDVYLGNLSAEVRYEYIHFVEVDQKPKTKVWECRNNRTGAVLGIVKWCGPWRQYGYFPSCEAVYSMGCLKDIHDFIGRQIESHKEPK